MRSRIHHVNIAALHFDETIKFYQDIFDLTIVEPTFAANYTQSAGTRFLAPQDPEVPKESEATSIHISDSTPGYAASVKELGVNPRLNGHFAIAVDDIEEVKSRLDAAGIFFVDAGRWAVRDYHQIYTYDPSMNLVEVNQAY